MNRPPVLLRATDKFLQLATDALGHSLARWRGAEVARGARFMGPAIITLAPRSRLVIGERAVLTSWSRWTALGVAHPVVLRTLTEGAELRIGRDTGMSGTAVCAALSVQIGERCLIGADVVITDTDFHALDPVARRAATDWTKVGTAGVCIGDDVFIGAGAVILKGVDVGDGAVIGAGSVVTRSVPARSVVAGNPARCLKTQSEMGQPGPARASQHAL